jgi:hypothetical protein
MTASSDPGARRRLLSLLVFALATLTAGAAAAQGELPWLSTRSIGMGGALRGAASGSAALSLNPSGISLARSYVVEGGYQYLRGSDGHLASLAITDSTSGFNIGGGLYYNYATASPTGLGERGRHEAGAALSLPFGDKVSLVGTIRYLRIRREMEAVLKPKTNGFTFDAGLTVRPASFLALGVAGRGLRDLEDPQAPLTLGGGVVLTPMPQLVVAVDAYNVEMEPVSYFVVSGGLEYTVASMFSMRAGGGRMDKDAFGSAGFSVVSEVGALDLGGQMGFSGGGDSLYIGISGRLFVPTQ